MKKEKIYDLLEIPKEVLGNYPILTIIGDKEINIENYKCIVEYSEDNIKINSSIGMIIINGNKLYIKNITKEDITITGTINNIKYSI